MVALNIGALDAGQSGVYLTPIGPWYAYFANSNLYLSFFGKFRFKRGDI